MTLSPTASDCSLNGWVRTMFDDMDECVIIYDHAGNILEVNPAACRHLGYAREELLAHTMQDMEDASIVAGYAGRPSQHNRHGQSRYVGRYRTKDGRNIAVDINTSVVQCDGKPAVLAMARASEPQGADEKALHQQIDQLHAILDKMRDGVIVADEQGKFLICNPAARMQFGIADTATELPKDAAALGVFLGDGVTPLPTNQFPLALAAAGETVDLAEIFVRPAQAPEGRWLTVTARPVFDSQSGSRGSMMVCRDNTSRKRVEKALRDSEAFYHALVENLPQNIFRKDIDSRFTFANHHFCATIKTPLPELIGKTDFDLFPAHLAQKYVEDDRKVMQACKVFDTVEEHRTPDGARLHVEVIKSPIFDKSGAVIGTQGVFWDVTERIRAEETIAASERRYRQLTEATQDGIILADQDGCVSLFNPAAERLFGYRAEEVVGKDFDLLMPAEIQDLEGTEHQRYREIRESKIAGRPFELEGRRKDGSTFPVEMALSFIETPGDKGVRHLQFLTSIRDLTERNRIRAVLVQNEKLASIGLLSAGVAHEINNPLAFVANNLVVLERDSKGLLEVMERHHSLLPRLAEVAPNEVAEISQLAEEIDLTYIRDNVSRLISRTREGVDRVTRIVRSLRGLARTDSPKRQDTDLPGVIDSALDILRGRLKRQNVEVVTNYEPHSSVTCVQTQINQVVLNLLVNAQQAIEATNRPDGRLTVHTKPLPDEMLLEIADNGTGIDPKNLPKLFDPFFTTKDVGEGTGLGLSIVHNIIRAHGGRVEVDSQLGVGTCFRVYLPLENSREVS